MTPYPTRRQKLLEQMPMSSVLLIFSKTTAETGDNPLCQNSDFYYFTGWNETDAVLLLQKTKKGQQQVLFCRHPNEQENLWSGPRLAPAKASKSLGFSAGYDYEHFYERLADMLLHCDVLYYPCDIALQAEQKVHKTVKQLHAKYHRHGILSPSHFAYADTLIGPMRLIKGHDEVEYIKRAAQISVHAHEQVRKEFAKYRYEYEVEANLMHAYRKANAYPAFAPIAAADKNSCVLHYVRNNQPIKSRLLVDSGAAYQHYCADITRCYVRAQDSAYKEIHDIVLAALQAGFSAALLGATLDDIHTSAVKTLVEGLVQLDIIKQTVQAAIQQETYKKFYPHATSHWIGLDVHDVGNYYSEKLRPGMVFSIEPGLYFLPKNTEVPERWRGIGIRLEDTILMTSKGAKNLTSGLSYDCVC